MHVFSINEYERPSLTGALNISATTPQLTDITMRDNHKEDIAIFRQTFDVNKSLKKQIVASIYKLYIKELDIHNQIRSS